MIVIQPQIGSFDMNVKDSRGSYSKAEQLERMIKSRKKDRLISMIIFGVGSAIIGGLLLYHQYIKIG